jgi:hypothetical protein
VAREGAGTKKQRDQLRTAMHDQGCPLEQIAAEMARHFGFRARQAWRHTHGFTQDDVATTYNRLLDDDQAPMTGKRISDYEAWPHGGVKPTINTLAMLAKVWSTEISNLVDLDDRQAFSPQELITLDAYKTPPPAVAPKSPDTSLKNNAQHPATTEERTSQSESPIPITTHHSSNMNGLPSRHYRWQPVLIVIALLTISTVIGAVLVARETTTTGAHAESPMPTASLPSTSRLDPSAPPVASSTSLPLTAPPSMPPSPVGPIPHQPFTPLSTPVRADNAASGQQISSAPQTVAAPPPAPASQQTPPPARPDSTPTVDSGSSATTAVSWMNMYYWRSEYPDLCLDEQEGDIIHDPANLQLWDCNEANNQKWTEKTIVANPTSIAKNLVSARTGRCVTYQPGDYTDHSKVWLTPCGKEGQGWIRIRNGTDYVFEAAQARGMCMTATSSPVTTPGTGGYVGIQLRPCDTSSLLQDWQHY